MISKCKEKLKFTGMDENFLLFFTKGSQTLYIFIFADARMNDIARLFGREKYHSLCFSNRRSFVDANIRGYEDVRLEEVRIVALIGEKVDTHAVIRYRILGAKW